jgi:dolichyl-phosphate beta-glucosyltransferase
MAFVVPPSGTAPSQTAPDWTVVIPAYNEEARLGETLRTILQFTQTLSAQTFEVIVVDDGSPDGTAARVERDFPGVRLLRNPGNRGKGYSVRAGLLESRGLWVLFSDADLSTPIQELIPCEERLRQGYDMVIASRALPDSVIEVHQAWWRERSGRLFNQLVRLISGLPYPDTQCGFKAYTRSAAHRIARLQRLDGFAFDVEQLRLARLLGFRVAEIPVHWINSFATRVRFCSDAPRMLRDVLCVRLTRYDLTEAQKDNA